MTPSDVSAGTDASVPCTIHCRLKSTARAKWSNRGLPLRSRRHPARLSARRVNVIT